MSDILLYIGLFVGYNALGFVNASFNHFLHDPNDRNVAFVFTWILWPPVLAFNLGACLIAFCSRYFSLEKWLDRVDESREAHIRRLASRGRKTKDITA